MRRHVIWRPLRTTLLAAFVLFVFVLGYGLGRSAQPGLRPGLGVVAEADEALARQALHRPSDAALSREIVRGIVSALDDPYADYLPRTAGSQARSRLREALGDAYADVPASQAVTGRLLGRDAGYLRVRLFTEGTGSLLRSKARSLRRAGAKAFVLDLRDNPGGFVDEALDVAGAFVGKQVVYRYRAANGRTGVTAARGVKEFSEPLVVLVNSKTASSGELLAGCLQDLGRGILVGSKTKGKGSVQKVVTLSDGSAIKFTAATYRTPSGRQVDGAGVQPDVAVSETPVDLALDRGAAIAGAR